VSLVPDIQEAEEEDRKLEKSVGKSERPCLKNRRKAKDLRVWFKGRRARPWVQSPALQERKKKKD
jgi:hypothetical protein